MTREFFIWSLPPELDEDSMNYYESYSWMLANRSHHNVIVMDVSQFDDLQNCGSLFEHINDRLGLYLDYSEGAVIEREDKLEELIRVIDNTDTDGCGQKTTEIVNKLKHIAVEAISNKKTLIMAF